MRGFRGATVGVLSVLVVSACASTSPTPGYQAATAPQLQQDVLAITRAASKKDYIAAQQALARLRHDLNAAQHAGQVDQSRAAQIAASADTVAADLAASLATSKATPSPAVSRVSPRGSAPKPTGTRKHRHHDGGQGDNGGQGGDNGD